MRRRVRVFAPFNGMVQLLCGHVIFATLTLGNGTPK